MADFAHLQQTMSSAKERKPRTKSTSGPEPTAVVKKKKKTPGMNKITPPPGMMPATTTVNGDKTGTAKKKKKKSADGSPTKAKSTKSSPTKETKERRKSSPTKETKEKKDEVPSASKKLTSRLGPVIQSTKQTKKTKAVTKVTVDKEREKKSKIWQALNPASLYHQTAEEKAADAEEKTTIDVRGGATASTFEMEDSQYERDAFGNIVLEESDDDITGFGDDDDFDDLADFDEDTKKMMLENRRKREAEADQRQKLLRKNSTIKKQAEDAKNAKIIAEIEKKEAKMLKKKEITNKMVTDTQKRLEKEIAFDFGFK